MSEGGEGASSKSVQLVLEEHHLFGLLLDHFEQLALLGNLGTLLLRIGGVLGLVLGLQRDDRLTIISLQLELSCFLLQLFVFRFFLTYLALELLLCFFDCLNPVERVFLKLFDLLLKTFLVLLISLGVLTLNDFLCLLGNTIELDIGSALLEVLGHQREFFLLKVNLFQLLLMF